MITILKIVLNSEPSALLKMSDMVGIELSQKPRRLHRFRNESSFDLGKDGGAKHVVERLSRDAVTTEDSHHVQQAAARRQRTQSIIECNA